MTSRLFRWRHRLAGMQNFFGIQDGTLYFIEFMKLKFKNMKESTMMSSVLCNAPSDLVQHECNLQEASTSTARLKLESWLNKNMKIEMTDGRTLIGIFLCTDRGRNVILGSCSEYLKTDGMYVRWAHDD